MPTRHNDRGLPWLEGPLLDAIFAGVYSHEIPTDLSQEKRDLLHVLYTMQAYNTAHRLPACAELFAAFEETVGPMERNSEGTTLWLALGLAVTDLYGLRDATLREMLSLVTVRL